MKRPAAAVAAAAVAVVVAGIVATSWSAPAQAQVFSPGPLSSAHAKLDGMTSCTKCHEGEGGKHSNARCLDCHKDVGARIDAGGGFHAKFAAQLCADCHREHKGGNASSLVDWSKVPGGGGAAATFNHALSGWPLQGAHKKNECKQCHEPRRIVDDGARKLMKDRGAGSGPAIGIGTFLGLQTACARCHFDEHRGQEGTECTRCHTNDDWKPTKFDHAPPFADFRLKGRHKAVVCEKCHDDANDDTTAENAFPKPRAKTYMQLSLKGVTQTSCTACHDDVHHGEFGRNCVKCHSEDGWKIIKQSAQDTGFHDKTEFPLRGEHTSVACKQCHGPFRSLGEKAAQKAIFKGLKHAKCADCHADAHAGQLTTSNDCSACHAVTGFTPVSFDVAAHKSARFALDGSHDAVACNLCHKTDKSLLRKVPAGLKRELAAKDRPLLVSDVKLALPDVVAGGGKCESCHQDPHAGQFAAKTCASCHATDAFSDVAKFDHGTSRFPLTGKHKDAACAACHFANADVKGRMRGVVMYAPVDVACAACHADQHVGQLGATCETCHATASFTPAKFDHDKQSSFALDGKHREVRCAGCHALVDVGPMKTARYKPAPKTCAGCHVDEHRGTFDAFVPATTAAATTTTATSKVPPAGCVACHKPAAWTPAAFAHERTPFALVGKHVGVVCSECHGSDTSRPIPTSCAGCHQDPHAQEFGLMCRSCHNENGFNAPSFTVDAHRRTSFPLVGRHAGIPCEECHVEKRERTFTRAALDCGACHAKDAGRASLTTVDHTRAPFASNCRSCHQPVSFTPAAFPQHEACFPIARGVHAPVSCAACHASSALRGVSFDGDCAGVSVRCAECHEHSANVEARHHKGVQGYAHESDKCAQCHRTP